MLGAFWPGGRCVDGGGLSRTILVLPNGAVLPPAVREGIDQALVVAETQPPDVARLLPITPP